MSWSGFGSDGTRKERKEAAKHSRLKLLRDEISDLVELDEWETIEARPFVGEIEVL